MLIYLWLNTIHYITFVFYFIDDQAKYENSIENLYNFPLDTLLSLFKPLPWIAAFLLC